MDVRTDSATQMAHVLRLEAEALTAAAARMDPEAAERAVTLLADAEKVIVAGVGKSGLIARKIASTMTSTGTMAVYLDPADALHGDIGIVSPRDVIVLLSNSGETDELLAILPHLNLRRAPIVAIVGNARSTLARAAAVVLDAAVDREACPHDLAPTTSTAVAMAIGDALAVALMQIRGLTREDFALNHPAGRLGKRLTLRVRDLMHPADGHTIVPEAGWLEVVSAISRGGLGAVAVVGGAGSLIGLITDGDLRRAIQSVAPEGWATMTAGTVMTARPVVVTPDVLAYHALQLMENRPSQISVLPVVDERGACVGVIRLHDIVRSGLA